jgi:hypothetical protein
MRRVILVVLGLMVGVIHPPRAWAEDPYRAASKLVQKGEIEAALKLIDEGLAAAPGNLELLLLRGHVLLKMRDFEGALVAYQKFLDAGAKGGNRREVIKIMNDLATVRTTTIEVKVANGPAKVYLDSRLYGVFCEAAPSCKKGVLPGDYKVILEREGFERMYVDVSVAANGTTTVDKTLVEKPSALTISVDGDLPGVVTVDGKEVGAAPRTLNVPGGTHEVTVRLERHAVAHEKVEAHLGAPVAVKISLKELLPVTLTPAGAELTVDGAPAVWEDKALAVARGEHKLHVAAPGFHEREVVVPAGARDLVAITLEPIGALVSVDGAPVGAEVSVDGKVIGTIPLSHEVEVPAGEHTVEIKKPGFLPFRTHANLAGNAPAQVHITNMRTTTRTKMWVATAVAGVGVATGVLFGIMAKAKQNDFANQASMAGVIGATDPQVASTRDEGNRNALIADIGFAAAVLAVGTATYFFLKEGKGESEGNVHGAPSAGPSASVSIGLGGFSISGRF